MVYFCKRRYFFTRSVYPTGFMQFFLNLAALKGASGLFIFIWSFGWVCILFGGVPFSFFLSFFPVTTTAVVVFTPFHFFYSTSM